MYAYCSNNPVMYADYSGESIGFFAAIAWGIKELTTISKVRYWSASKINGVVHIHPEQPLTFAQAVKRVVSNENVFAVTKEEDELVALTAGDSAMPMEHPSHRTSLGYYPHYHMHNHSNDAHVWYLF